MRGNSTAQRGLSLLTVLIVLVVLVGAFAGYQAWEDHQTKLKTEQTNQAYRDDVNKISSFEDEWAPAEKLASQTARIAVGDRVADLQRLKRQAASFKFATPCISEAQADWLDAMTTTIDGFMAFMGDHDEEAQTGLQKGGAAHLAFIDAVHACRPIGYTPEK